MHTKLPHLNLHHHYQFITFRTFDSIDDYVIKMQQNERIVTKIKQYEIDKYLDTSHKGSYFYDELIDKMREILLEKDTILYEVVVFVIMPNHIHIVIKQLDDLVKIVKYIKGKSAIQANKFLGKKGKFWLDGYFDKAIRDEKHFNTVCEYVLNNPIKANLADWEKRVYSVY